MWPCPVHARARPAGQMPVSTRLEWEARAQKRSTRVCRAGRVGHAVERQPSAWLLGCGARGEVVGRLAAAPLRTVRWAQRCILVSVAVSASASASASVAVVLGVTAFVAGSGYT
jgi:hypothetical protein